LTAGFDRRAELLTLLSDYILAALEHVFGRVPQFLSASPQVIAALGCPAAKLGTSFRAGLRSENHSNRDTDSETEKEVRQTLVLVHGSISLHQ
jgi:hypothetical protein